MKKKIKPDEFVGILILPGAWKFFANKYTKMY